MLSLIPGIRNMGIGVASNVISLNSGLLRKNVLGHSFPPALATHYYQHIHVCICGPQILKCARCYGKYLRKTQHMFPTLNNLLRKEKKLKKKSELHFWMPIVIQRWKISAQQK